MINETQRLNCWLLAEFLESNVTDSQYDHSIFGDENTSTHCALGWAIFSAVLPEAEVLRANGYEQRNISDDIFGSYAYDVVFNNVMYPDTTRLEAVAKLRHLAL